MLYIYNEESMNIDDRSERVCDIAFFSSPSKFFLYKIPYFKNIYMLKFYRAYSSFIVSSTICFVFSASFTASFSPLNTGFNDGLSSAKPWKAKI